MTYLLMGAVQKAGPCPTVNTKNLNQSHPSLLPLLPLGQCWVEAGLLWKMQGALECHALAGPVPCSHGLFTFLQNTLRGQFLPIKVIGPRPQEFELIVMVAIIS